MLSVASREYFWKRVNIFMMKGGEAEGRGWGGGGKKGMGNEGVKWRHSYV